MRLIDADALEQTLDEMIESIRHEMEYDKYDGIKKDIRVNTIESVLDEVSSMDYMDAVEVVRCKNCTHRDPEDKRCDHSRSGNCPFPMDDEDFCSDGERCVENEPDQQRSVA